MKSKDNMETIHWKLPKVPLNSQSPPSVTSSFNRATLPNPCQGYQLAIAMGGHFIQTTIDPNKELLVEWHS